MRRYLSEAARTAPKQAEAPESGRGFELLVVASRDPRLGYRWEVRRHDGLLLERSIETYGTTLLAWYAGVQALDG